MFNFERVSVCVDTNSQPGKTIIDFDGKGNVLFIKDVNRDAFLNLLIADIKKLNDKNIDLKNF